MTKHTYGDVVLYQRGKDTVNALVVQSHTQADGEHMMVVYLDPVAASPRLSGTNVEKAIATAFVSPLTDGKTFGWKDRQSSSDYLVESIMPHLIELSKTVATIAPSMEISPEGTVISANTLLQEILLKKPEPAPAQLEPLTEPSVLESNDSSKESGTSDPA